MEVYGGDKAPCEDGSGKAFDGQLENDRGGYKGCQRQRQATEIFIVI